jgi:hypothetical protein
MLVAMAWVVGRRRCGPAMNCVCSCGVGAHETLQGASQWKAVIRLIEEAATSAK